jgi:hypothetical protein
LKTSRWQKYLRASIAAVVLVIVSGLSVALVLVAGQAQKVPKPEEQAVPSRLDQREFSSRSVQEMMDYVECLKEAKCAFRSDITGEEAAKQFGYGRLFASAYEEMTLRARGLEHNQHRPQSSDIIVGFETILREEQEIAQRLAGRKRHAAAIAYLRSLQKGDVVFPTPKHSAPPQLMLIYLMSNNPGVAFNIYDPEFAGIYRDTREFMAARLKQTDTVSMYEAIGEFRRLIVQSAASPRKYHGTELCEKGALTGQLAVMARVCPAASPNDFAKELTGEISQQPEAIRCERRAATALQSEIDSMPKTMMDKVCKLLEQHLRTTSRNMNG